MPITLAPQYTQREYRWTGFKAVAASHNLLVQYDAGDPDVYVVWGYDGPEVHLCTLWRTEVPPSVVAAGYTQAQNDADRAEFEAGYQAGANKSLAPTNADGIPLDSAEPRLGTEVLYATHNFSDKTTWFGESVRVDGEVATDDGAGTIWSLAHAFVIDMTHGKTFDEAQYVLDQQAENPSEPHGYAVVVKVDGNLQAERAPFAASGGDYEVDYAAGNIVFFASQAGSTVTVDYSYATGSMFLIKPDDGTDIDIEGAKASWSDDFVMNDTVLFEVWGLAAVFAPQLGLPPGTKIPIQTTKYLTLTQLTGEAFTFYPFAVAVCGSGARGIGSPRHVVGFSYNTIRRLISAAGLELQVSLENDQVFGGEFTSATFYCTVREA